MRRQSFLWKGLTVVCPRRERERLPPVSAPEPGAAQHVAQAATRPDGCDADIAMPFVPEPRNAQI